MWNFHEKVFKIGISAFGPQAANVKFKDIFRSQKIEILKRFTKSDETVKTV